MADKTQKLVLSIIEFLNTSIGDGTVKEDDRESLEVAVQCIGEAFGVDPHDSQQRERLSIKPATLPSIFDVYLKTQARMAAGASSSSASASKPVPKAPAGPSAADKAEAEKLKAAGNAAMSSKQYSTAIESYTKSIKLDSNNPVYYSNRAAAYSSTGDHASAVADAKKAIDVDPKFVKAYHRLGHAQYSQGEYSAAAAAFKKGLDLDPNNTNLKTGYDSAKTRLDAADDEDIPNNTAPESRGASAAAGAGLGAGAGGMPDLAAMASMFGGGGAGGGGMPDLASLMSNPAIASMASGLMANGGLERMMQNPEIARMAERYQSGGGMPSMAELASNPALRDLAGQFGRGGGGGAP